MGSDFSAVDDFYNVNEDEELDVPVEQGVIANDIFPLESSITAELVQSPSHGTVNLAPDGSFVYVPQGDYFGSEAFRYRLSDGERYSNTASVRIYVHPINDPPIALDQNLSTFMNEALELELVFIDDGWGISIAAREQNTVANNSLDSAYTYFYSCRPMAALKEQSLFVIYYTRAIDLGTFSHVLCHDGEYYSNIRRSENY